MFTGLVTDLGTVKSIRKSGATAVLSLDSTLPDVAIGDSIAINGVCLTVTSITGNTLSFDLSDETMGSTNLGELKSGGRVNLEPSLRANGKLGGHFVTGHVDAVGRIRKNTAENGLLKIEVSAPPGIMEFFVEKGSVALDGISLTVVDVLKDGFTIVIIPHTQTATTIGWKSVGDSVNIETDIIGKYVYRFINKDKKSNETFMKKLMEGGFVR